MTLMQLPTHRARLHARAPFDFRHTLSFACGFTPMAGEQDAGDGRYTKALVVAGQPVVVQLAPAQDGDDPGALDLTIASPRALDAPAVQGVIERVRFVLGLDDDLAPFYALARGDAALAPVVRALHGFHHLKFPSAFEIACWAVLGQRAPMGIARRQKRAITERFGACIELEGRAYRAFPDAKRLAEVPPAELERLVPVARKAASLAAIAQAFAPIDGDALLRALPFGEAERWLRALPGIGAWSTAFVLFRGLGRMESPTLEGPLIDCARRVYDPRASEASLARIAERYGEHVGSWALYLRVGAGEGAHAIIPRAA